MAESAREGRAEAGGGKTEGVVDYVFVVHGMGHPRRNATSVDVICRFDDACAGRTNSTRENRVTLGATGQGEPWSEFEGVVAMGSPNPVSNGQRSSSGTNLRFVDIHWSDITERAVEAVAEPADRWVRKVAQYLGSHQASLAKLGDKAAVPFWLTHLVRLIRPLVRVARPVLAMVNRPLGELVFSEYLGDVQVYCECPDVRGRAIARFHRYLSGVLRRHVEEEKKGAKPRAARFTIVAHSLGSLLSLDAILTAHFSSEARGAIPGYDDEIRRLGDTWKDAPDRESQPAAPREPLPPLAWLGNLHALVTLGCPAEKAAALWPQNHAFHVDPASIRQAIELRGDRRVPHVNFVEAMDVVADPLAYYRQSRLYQAVLVPNHEGEKDLVDRITTNDARPFLAHTSYWNDVDVFQRIREVVWGAAPSATPSAAVGRDRIRDHVFGLIPTLAGIAVSLAAAAMLSAGSVTSAAIATVVFGGLTFLGIVLLRVLAWWWYLSEARTQSEGLRPSPPWWSTFYWITCLIVSALAYAHFQDESEGHPLAPALATIGLAGLAVVLWHWARDRKSHGINVAPYAVLAFVAYLLGTKRVWHRLFGVEPHPEALVTTAFLLGICLCLSGQSAGVPMEARVLRRRSVPAFLSAWFFSALLWLLVWGAHQVLWKPSASAGSGVPSLADQALRFVGLNRDHLAVGFLFGATAIGAFLTVVRHEVGLARQTLDLERWRRQRWEDYLAPTLERPLEPARTGDAP